MLLGEAIGPVEMDCLIRGMNGHPRSKVFGHQGLGRCAGIAGITPEGTRAGDG